MAVFGASRIVWERNAPHCNIFASAVRERDISRDNVDAILEPLRIKVLRTSEGFQGVSSTRHRWLPRDASLSGSYASDRCGCSSLGLDKIQFRDKFAQDVVSTRNYALGNLSWILLYQDWIVITLFRLSWHQTEFYLVQNQSGNGKYNLIFNSIRFRNYFSACREFWKLNTFKRSFNTKLKFFNICDVIYISLRSNELHIREENTLSLNINLCFV